jgi:hypothetical protein
VCRSAIRSHKSGTKSTALGLGDQTLSSGRFG